MLKNPFNIEVTVEKEGDMYFAKTPNFPGCIGMGETEESSLKDLKKAICVYLKENVEGAVDRLFEGRTAFEVQLDQKNRQPRHIRRHVYSLLQSMLKKEQQEMLRQKKNNIFISMRLPRQESRRNERVVNPDVEVFFRPDFERLSPIDQQPRGPIHQLKLGLDLSDVFQHGLPYIADIVDGMVMGVPLNMN